MICPKCGFEQKEGPECLRCGLIFIRYHATAADPLPKTIPAPDIPEPAIGYFRRFYRVFRWVSLIVVIIVIALILHPSKPPHIAISPDSTQRAEEKIREFQTHANQGTEQRLEMDESELNGWLAENLSLKKSDNAVDTPSPQTEEAPIDPAEKETGGQAPDSASLEEVQSSVRDIKLQLLEDSLHAYVVFDLHGMNLSLELEGRLLTRDGYMRLEPTSGKLGSFPLMAGTLQSAVSRLFDSPENKEKFRLPPHIRDIRIEHGQFIVISN
jgi:hypothetical protein